MLTRDSFFAPRELPRHELPIADLGGSVYVRTLTAGEFLALQERIDGDKANAFAHWIINGITDEQGHALFSDADIDRLRDLPIGLVERMTAAVQKHNFVTKDTAKGNSKARAA